MPTSTVPSPSLLKRLTEFIAAQDGSETKAELLPKLSGRLAVGRGSPPSEADVSDIIRKVQSNVKHFHERLTKREKAEAEYTALQERMSRSRLTPARKAQMETINAHIIKAYNTIKKPARTAQITAEEKLVNALAELRQRNAHFTELREEEKKRAVEERKAKRKAEKKEREESMALGRAEKRAAEAKKRDEEIELKTKLRDQRALQQLEAKAIVINLEKEQMEEVQQAKRINGMLEELLVIQLRKAKAEERQKRAREDDIVETDDDQENVDPRHGWRV